MRHFSLKGHASMCGANVMWGLMSPFSKLLMMGGLAITPFVVTGLLYLIDKWVGFGHLGLPWVMQKDTMLLYAAIIFLWFKSDKSVGLILLGIWLIQNIGLVISLLGQMSTFLLPATLLVIGVLLYFLSSRG